MPSALLLQRRRDLLPERVRVVELHHAAPRPRAARYRAGVALDGDHLVTPPSQPGSDEQAGRTRADNGYAHDHHPPSVY